MSRAVTIGSLFAGVGGLELGLSWALARAGFDVETLFQVEINPFCRGVLAMHWPHAERFEDVTQVGRANLPLVDVLCGGFPCQDLSTAGKGAGLDGDRSGLWREFARIIEEIRPRYVVVENVAALVARGLDRVVADLGRLAYRVYGRIVAASDVGAPHRRERLFLVAHTDRARCEGGDETGRLATESGEGLADAAGERRDGGGEVALGRLRGRHDGAQGSGEGHPATELADRGDDGREGREARDGADGGVGVERRGDPDRRDTDVADAHGHGHGLRKHEQRLPGGRSGSLCDGGNTLADDDRISRGGGAESVLGRDSHGASDRLDGRAVRSELALSVRESVGGVRRASDSRGRVAHDLPPRIDRWPARPGEPQHDWEPPRSIAVYSPTTNLRLHAIGNGVVPHVADDGPGALLAHLLLSEAT